jgi:hypothetical protein
MHSFFGYPLADELLHHRGGGRVAQQCVGARAIDDDGVGEGGAGNCWRLVALACASHSRAALLAPSMGMTMAEGIVHFPPPPPPPTSPRDNVSRRSHHRQRHRRFLALWSAAVPASAPDLSLALLSAAV